MLNHVCLINPLWCEDVTLWPPVKRPLFWHLVSCIIEGPGGQKKKEKCVFVAGWRSDKRWHDRVWISQTSQWMNLTFPWPLGGGLVLLCLRQVNGLSDWLIPECAGLWQAWYPTHTHRPRRPDQVKTTLKPANVFLRSPIRRTRCSPLQSPSVCPVLKTAIWRTTGWFFGLWTMREC